VFARERGVQVRIVRHETRLGHFDSAQVDLWDAARGWLRENGFFDDRFALAEADVYFERTREAKIAVSPASAAMSSSMNWRMFCAIRLFQSMWSGYCRRPTGPLRRSLCVAAVGERSWTNWRKGSNPCGSASSIWLSVRGAGVWNSTDRDGKLERRSCGTNP
jgi:hypothetical protein